MELSDSDDEQDDEMEKSSTVRLKSNSKSVNKRNEKGNLKHTSYLVVDISYDVVKSLMKMFHEI